MRVKTSELTGAALDWAVALILKKNKGDWLVVINPSGDHGFCTTSDPENIFSFSPSKDWADGGYLLDEYDVFFDRLTCGQVGVDNCIVARCGIPHPDWSSVRGKNRLEAGMRAIVKYVHGDFFDIPDRLLYHLTVCNHLA